MEMALVGAGRVSASLIARLPRLSQRLGPVAAQSYRLASRIANSLGAGFAVKSYEECATARIFLLCVPELRLERVVQDLARCGISWSGKVVVICDTRMGSGPADPLRELGAAAGSLQLIEKSSPQRQFLIEGDAVAVRESRRLIQQMHGRAFEIDRERLPIYWAGISFATSLFTPLMDASACLFTQAGIDSQTAMRLSGSFFQESLRSYLRAGRKSWKGALAEGDMERLASEMEALERMNPRLARHYRASVQFAREVFGDSARYQERRLARVR